MINQNSLKENKFNSNHTNQSKNGEKNNPTVTKTKRVNSETDIFTMIKTFKKELTKNMKEQKDIIVHENISEILKEIDQLTKYNNNVPKKESILDEPFLKKFENKRKSSMNRNSQKNKNKINKNSDFGEDDEVYSKFNNSVLINQKPNEHILMKLMNQSQLTKSKNTQFYEISIARKQQRDIKIESQRNSKLVEEQKNNLKKPTLTENTKRILSTMGDDKPLYLRTKEILDKKRDDLFELKKYYKDQDELNLNEGRKDSKGGNNSFCASKLTRSCSEPTQGFNNWRKEAIEWLINKKKRNEETLKEREEIEKINQSSHPFQPSLNSNSIHLASLVNNESLLDRLCDRTIFERKKISKIEKILKATTPEFKPYTHKSLPKYLNQVDCTILTRNLNKKLKKKKLINRSIEYEPSYLLADKSILINRNKENTNNNLNNSGSIFNQNSVFKIDNNVLFGERNSKIVDSLSKSIRIESQINGQKGNISRITPVMSNCLSPNKTMVELVENGFNNKKDNMKKLGLKKKSIDKFQY